MDIRHSLLVATFLGVIGSPAAASQFKIRFDDDSADRIIAAFETGRADRATIDAIAASPAYALLFDQVAAATRPRRSRDDVAEDFRKSLRAALAGEAGPGFGLEEIRARPEDYRAALLEIRRREGDVAERIDRRLDDTLPPLSGFESTAHLVVGGKATGMAFSDRNDVALRLDAFVSRTRGGPADVDRFAGALAHELWHVGYRSAGGLPPRPEPPPADWVELARRWGPDLVGEVWRASGDPTWNASVVEAKLEAWVPSGQWTPAAVDRLLALLTRLQNEGTAGWVEMPLRDGLGSGRAEREAEVWLKDIERDFAMLAAAVDFVAGGGPPEGIEGLAAIGFSDNGPFYRAGYRMAERIEERAGRRPFLDAIRGGPLEFLETYFETRPDGPRQLEAAASRELKSLIREIRAVGEFDPRP